MNTEEISNLSKSLPHELIIEILSRLPVKSLCRFRCVSDLWNSTISDQNFIKLHYNRSLSRPDGTSILLAFYDYSHHVKSIYAVDHPDNDYPVAINLLTISSPDSHYVSESVNGLICIATSSGVKICNPSTREVVALPIIQEEQPPFPYNNSATIQFGYDPINNQHKVLSVLFKESRDNLDDFIMQIDVFALGDVSWRRISYGPLHIPQSDGVCVNGVVYYRATTNMENPLIDKVIAFDVRFETFRCIQMPNVYLNVQPALIHYDGHVAFIDYQYLKSKKHIDICVLKDDSSEPNWIRKRIDFSSAAWIDTISNHDFYLICVNCLFGTLRNDEIILVPCRRNDPIHLLLVNLKNSSIRRVNIRYLQGYELRIGGVYSNVTFTDHVESIITLRS